MWGGRRRLPTRRPFPQAGAFLGCYPIAHSLARQSPHTRGRLLAPALQVNVDSEDMNETCERLGVDRLPWFQLVRDGVVLASFTANLTTIARVRAEMAQHDAGPAPASVAQQALGGA